MVAITTLEAWIAALREVQIDDSSLDDVLEDMESELDILYKDEPSELEGNDIEESDEES